MSSQFLRYCYLAFGEGSVWKVVSFKLTLLVGKGPDLLLDCMLGPSSKGVLTRYWQPIYNGLMSGLCSLSQHHMQNTS